MNAVLLMNHLDDLNVRKRGRLDADEDAGIFIRTLEVLGCVFHEKVMVQRYEKYVAKSPTQKSRFSGQR